MNVITVKNVVENLRISNVIQKSRLYRVDNKWKQYVLLKDVMIQLTTGEIITIKKGFEWDLSSVPRLFWALLAPDGDFEIAALIHDYLYQNHIGKRKAADLEMFIWSRTVNGTQKISMRRIDNHTRYYGVRLFGGFVWNKKRK